MSQKTKAGLLGTLADKLSQALKGTTPRHVDTQPSDVVAPNDVAAAIRTWKKQDGDAADSSPRKGPEQPHAPASGNEIARRTRGRVTLNIGFDFGTCMSKAVLRDRVKAKAWAVPLSVNTKHSRYLLPTSVSELDGGYSLDGTLGRTYVDLKYKYIKDINCNLASPRSEAEITCIAFLALAFRRVNAWFDATFAAQYSNQEVNWEVRMGVPVRAIRGTGPSAIAARFHHALTLATHLARTNIDVTRDAVVSLLMCNDPVATGIVTGIYPEVLSEVLGYVKSTERLPGLHFLVDVGGTTVDVATFTIHAVDDREKLPVLQADVSEIGCQRFHDDRLLALNERVDGLIGETSLSSAMDEPIPEIGSLVRDMGSALEQNERKQVEIFRQLLWEVLKDTRQVRDPKSSHWTEGLRCFLCGGGRHFAPYAGKFHDLMKDHPSFGMSLRFQPLPIPKDLEGVDADDSETFERLAVAYGLSFSEDDSPDADLPESIADLRAGVRPAEAEMITKEMV